MLSKLLSHYKIPLFVSFTLGIALVAIRVIREPVDIIFVAFGVFFGTFILDLDYLIYAFFLEPESDFSRTVAAFFRHKDFASALNYIHYHKEEIGERTLNSVLFQLALIAVTILGISASTNYFVKALILSTFVNSIYRLAELYFSNDYEKWFWALKNKPAKHNVVIYMFALIAVLAYSASIF